MFPCRTHTSKGASTRGALRGIWGIYKDEIQALSSSTTPTQEKKKSDSDAEKIYIINYKYIKTANNILILKSMFE